ncbi:kinase-like domain-containing protein [Syncephalis plumigaleata]|nr:kinase-like domain-containing protein [Syncephalis plumigaleata]
MEKLFKTVSTLPPGFNRNGKIFLDLPLLVFRPKHRAVCAVYETYREELLADYIKRTDNIYKRVVTALKYYKQVLRGLAFLHRIGFVHRGLTYKDIVLKFVEYDRSIEQQIVVKNLRYTGNLNFLSRNPKSPGTDPVASIVAPRHQLYCAPEVTEHKPVDPRKVDIWDAGVSFYRTIFNTVPLPEAFKSTNANELKNAIRTQLVAHMWKILDHSISINGKMKMLVKQTISQNDARDPHMIMLVELITKLMDLDADKRPLLDTYISELDVKNLNNNMRSMTV